MESGEEGKLGLFESWIESTADRAAGTAGTIVA